jgi:membrane protein implicated in regulation of membrane protease activity
LFIRHYCRLRNHPALWSGTLAEWDEGKEQEMITDILAWTPGLMKLFAILFVFIVPVLLVVLVIIFVHRSSKKRRELQIELDKLAGELEQIKKQAEAGRKD